MVIRKHFLTLLGILFFTGLLNAQVSESCECVVDTAGLASYLETLNLNENQPLTFEVENANSTFAVLHGYIATTTPNTVNDFIANYPNVTTLVFMQVPGSLDDEANLIASQALRNVGYKHYIPNVTAYAEDAFIASGGVDMFVGGVVRVVDQGAEVGVHSWTDGVNDATFYPPGHQFHQPYIDYYVNVGFSQQEAEDFYYFTINAAPAAGVHFMSESELNQYGTRTCTYAPAPDYSVSQNGASIEADLAGASYQWLDCNNGMAPLTGETSQTLTAPDNGSYAVIVTENSCMDTSACFTVDFAGIEDLENETSATLFPNPAENELNITGNFNFTGSKLEITNSIGQRVLYKDALEQKNDISGLPEGVYIVHISTLEGKITRSFVKQ